jgi:hypothetical protein
MLVNPKSVLITGTLPSASQYTLRLRIARLPQTINAQI